MLHLLPHRTIQNAIWDDVQMRAPQGARLLWQGYGEPAAWLALIWSALGPGALAAYLQTQVGARQHGTEGLRTLGLP
jgi:hypothetical protein